MSLPPSSPPDNAWVDLPLSPGASTSQVSFASTNESLSPESSVSQVIRKKKADVGKEAPGMYDLLSSTDHSIKYPSTFKGLLVLIFYFTVHIVLGRWSPYFESKRGAHDGKQVWKWACKQPDCNHEYVQSGGGGGGRSLGYHMMACHRPLFDKVVRQSMKQLTLTEMAVPASKKEQVAYSGLQWLIADFQPFSTFDSPHFRQFIQTCSPMLTPPSAATIRSKLPLYRLQLYTLIVELMERNMVGGSITLDSWTSRSNRPFLAITFHWLDNHFQYHECVLDMAAQPYPHTAANTARLVSKFGCPSRIYLHDVHCHC